MVDESRLIPHQAGRFCFSPPAYFVRAASHSRNSSAISACVRVVEVVLARERHHGTVGNARGLPLMQPQPLRRLSIFRHHEQQ